MTELHEHLALDKNAQDLLFREARTANTFTDEPVTEEQIAAIYDLVKYAPTSMNIQPLRILLVRSPEGRERLVSSTCRTATRARPAPPRWSPCSLTTPSSTSTCPPSSRISRAPRTSSRARTTGSAASLNATLQVGYFILGVRAAGLAAGPMTGFDAEGIDKEFFAETGYKTLVVVNIGKPGENAWFPRNPRLEHNQVITTA
jgi:3-hydroxypropanoate dehydrogenase